MKKSKIAGIIGNGAILVLDVVVLLLIIGLFLHKSTAQQPVKATIEKFTTTTENYYPEGEVYHQVSDRIKTYQAAGQPK